MKILRLIFFLNPSDIDENLFGQIEAEISGRVVIGDVRDHLADHVHVVGYKAAFHIPT